MSTIRPKCLRKSATRIGLLTSAMMKIKGSDRLRPRLSVREHFPYVSMEVLLTAVSERESGVHRRLAEVGG